MPRSCGLKWISFPVCSELLGVEWAGGGRCAVEPPLRRLLDTSLGAVSSPPSPEHSVGKPKLGWPHSGRMGPASPGASCVCSTWPQAFGLLSCRNKAWSTDRPGPGHWQGLHAHLCSVHKYLSANGLAVGGDPTPLGQEPSHTSPAAAISSCYPWAPRPCHSRSVPPAMLLPVQMGTPLLCPDSSLHWEHRYLVLPSSPRTGRVSRLVSCVFMPGHTPRMGCGCGRSAKDQS